MANTSQEHLTMPSILLGYFATLGPMQVTISLICTDFTSRNIAQEMSRLWRGVLAFTFVTSLRYEVF